MALPIGNTGSRETKVLSTLTMPEWFDLQQRNIEDDRGLQDIIKMYGDRVSPLYNKSPFMSGNGEWKTFTEMDVQTYGNIQPEGTNPQLIKYGIGRTLNFTYVDYGNAYTATARAIKNNKQQEVFSRINNLPRMLQNRRYLDGVHQLTFGLSSSYTNLDGVVVDLKTVDGLSPFNAAHTLPLSATTYTNIVPGNPVYSKAGQLAAELLFKTDIKDGYGVRKIMAPTHLITSDDPTTIYNVRQINGSAAEVGQANAAVINVLNRFTHVILPQLDSDATGNVDATKSAMWILGRFGVDGVDMKYCEGEAIATHAPAEDPMNGNVTTRISGGWIFKIISGMGMVVSKP
jgi:hypothetical protein